MSDAACHLVEGRSLTRRNIEAAIQAATMPVRLVDCDLQEIDLSRLDIGGFAFERCTLIESDLSHVQAASTRWTSCRARGAKLRGADMTDAVFAGGDWNGSDWQSARIASVHFAGVKLTAADFRGTRSIGVVFEDCPMQSAILAGLSFRRLRLGRCDMTRADVRECDFHDAVFAEGSSLSSALVTGARFDGADLREVDMSGHGVDALKAFAGARISAMQAATIVASAGLRVG